MTDSITPLTIIGGWLGAGKTTMLNRLLATTSERIAVIVNDVGDVNVDADLLKEYTGTDPANADGGAIELTNGCVCCSIGEDLYLTLHELTLRNPAPERIVLEASGVADPRQVAEFTKHRRVSLDAVIVLADANDFAGRSARPPYGSLMRSQLAGADLVVATKLDLIEPDARAAAMESLAEFTDARIVAAVDEPGWLQQVMLGVHHNELAAEPQDLNPHVATATWRPSGLVDVQVVQAELAAASLLRAKGSVTTNDGPVRIHLAGGRFVTESIEDEPLNALVLIGETHAEVDDLAERLDQVANG